MGVARLGEREKERKMIECVECGREVIVIDGDCWDTVCRECHAEAMEAAHDEMEAAATGN